MKVLNKKIRNATVIEYEGNKFKSKLECNCAKLLDEANIGYQYEGLKFTLLSDFIPDINIYELNRKKEFCNTIHKKKLPITYTPDFIVNAYKMENNVKVYYSFIIECKGIPNDVFPIKKKLFLNLLNNSKKVKNLETYYFEPHNIKQIKIIIDVIKQLNVIIE